MSDAVVTSPFPPRQTETVRVDSVAEEYDYLAAWPLPGGAWQPAGQVLVPGPAGPEDHLTVRRADGETAVVRFAIRSFFSYPPADGAVPGERVSAVMRAGQELAQAEGPLHPGSLPQYPVPAEAHAGAVSVPLAVLAAEAGRRGLYAPPRIAVVRWPAAEAVGVGDAPGFDPSHWPPPRLGDWPPAAVRDWEPPRLAGAIARFSAIWARLLDTWFSGETYLQLEDEKREAILLLDRLVPAALLEFYASLSPRFWAWLAADQTP